MKIDTLRIAVLIAAIWNPLCGGLAAGKTQSGVSHRTRKHSSILDQKPVNQQGPRKKAGIPQESKNETAESELKELKGNWQVVRWEDESGQPATAEEMKDFVLTFEGDQLTMRKGKDDPGTRCQYRIDPSKQPKWIDMGMPGLAAGATVLEGIYRLEGDDLSLCITSGLRNGLAPPRPTEFKTRSNEKYAVLVLKRIP